jgi:hypothetical protein
MPVAGSDNKIELAGGHKLVDPLGDLISIRYRECSTGREVVLKVDDYQRPSHISTDHLNDAPRLGGVGSRSDWP